MEELKPNQDLKKKHSNLSIFSFVICVINIIMIIINFFTKGSLIIICGYLPPLLAIFTFLVADIPFLMIVGLVLSVIDMKKANRLLFLNKITIISTIIALVGIALFLVILHVF